MNDESNAIQPASTSTPTDRHTISRRGFVARATAAAGLAGLLEMNRQAQAAAGARAPISPRESIKVTKLETFVLRNTWVFVKISTDAGITGWGEMLKDEAKACAAGALEVEDYLIGKDPRRVVLHWQAIHRHAFYRGGPIKTARPQRHRPGAVGHQGQGPRACRSTSCSAARPATGSGSTARSERRTAAANACKVSRPSRKAGRRTSTSRGRRSCEEVAKDFAALAREARPGGGHRHRFPRRRSAADGHAADQGPGAVPAVVLSRSWSSA